MVSFYGVPTTAVGLCLLHFALDVVPGLGHSSRSEVTAHVCGAAAAFLHVRLRTCHESGRSSASVYAIRTSDRTYGTGSKHAAVGGWG